ncbi:hypothetical protein AAFF_G00400670 [Aldrovandia affinis]|uniref:Secreted protein n=1 Tax=Aldrovandia affinis TaxID=143900 RepID=A0AAD7SCT6_9TELE|nr:hypothetical protein AAFF_G00400670 [Aldrovandia affinis]
MGFSKACSLPFMFELSAGSFLAAVGAPPRSEGSRWFARQSRRPRFTEHAKWPLTQPSDLSNPASRS